MRKKYVVAEKKDLPVGGRLIVDVEGRSIGIFNLDGRYFAIRNRCPHQGAPLCRHGNVVGDLVAERPGCYAYNPERKFIQCTWHGWEFDLATGQSWFDPQKTRMRAYDVAVEKGSAIVHAIGEDTNGLQQGPYKVEVFQVEVEGEYLVLIM